MRRIYTYRVIRYFPHVLSDEFVNVGVILTSSKDLYRILTVDEAKQLHCSALISEKKRFMGVIEHLNTLATDNRLLEGNHYFHNFRFSEEKRGASEKTDDVILQELFDDYIGYKIHSEAKAEEKKHILEESILLVEKSFKNFLKIKKDGIFDLELEHIQKNILHRAQFGHGSWKQDIGRIVTDVPPLQNRANDEIYEFLDITGKIEQHPEFKNKLSDNCIDSYLYATEDERARYLEVIARAA